MENKHGAIFFGTEEDLNYLDKVVEIKKLFDSSLSISFIHKKTLNKNELKKNIKI